MGASTLNRWVTTADEANCDAESDVGVNVVHTDRRRSNRVAPPAARMTWLRMFAISALAIVGYTGLSGGLAEVWFQAVAWTSVAIFAYGVHRHRLVSLSWLMIGGGFALFVVGDLLFSLNEHVFHIDAFPSSADVAYLAGYPMLAIGLAALARRGTTSSSALIDAGIVVTPLAVAAFVYIIEPTADAGVTVSEKLVSAAYPIGDLVCLAVLVRLIAGLNGTLTTGRRTGRGSPALGMLVTSLLTLLLGDVIFLSTTLADRYVSGGWCDGIYLIAYVALAATAFDPSATGIAHTTSDVEVDVTLSTRRLSLLAIAALLTPTVMAIQWMRDAALTVPLVVAGTVMSFLLVVARMSGLVQALESSRGRLRFEATHDMLTGLPNRLLFSSRLDETLRRGAAGALLFVDLDRFKAVNDTLGHHEGDEVLTEVAQLLRSAVRDTDMVARLAGDEFVVLVESANDTEVLLVAERLVTTIRVTRPAGAETMLVTASIGLAQWPAGTGPDRADDLMRAADRAMYDAKHLHGNQLVIAPR